MSAVAAHSLRARLIAEALGTALLLVAIVGSGIMGERLAGGNAAVALLANSVATGCALFALITMFAPISGAHFNPVVTLVEYLDGRLAGRDAIAYVAVQCAAAIVGVLIAHLMFELPLWLPSQHVRTGAAQWFSELVATFGLLNVILFGAKARSAAVPAMVASYITAAYWFTASTSFANPAVTLARALTDTFAGIRAIDTPMFVLAQVAGALAAWFVYRSMRVDEQEVSRS
ncbi:MAG: aquaporin family protein [Betaproteobacteria bacterium]|nr:aquaporin family protein [Betaproteobacteria bacterium]